MAGMEFDCGCCGAVSDAVWPPFGFRRPDPYLALEEHERRHHAQATDDLCVIHRSRSSDHFLRGLLSIRVLGEQRTLEYGPWVSVSSVDFTDHLDHYSRPEHRERYTGQLANAIPGYRDCSTIPVQVLTQGLLRPRLVPDSTFAHPLVRDFFDGITPAEAELRVRSLLLREPT